MVVMVVVVVVVLVVVLVVVVLLLMVCNRILGWRKAPDLHREMRGKRQVPAWMARPRMTS